MEIELWKDRVACCTNATFSPECLDPVAAYGIEEQDYASCVHNFGRTVWPEIYSTIARFFLFVTAPRS